MRVLNSKESVNIAYETEYAAGFDLRSTCDFVLRPKERVAIPTGIYLTGEPRDDVFIQILPRSGLAYKFGIDILAGVIDSDYRDEIKVILINHGHDNFRIKEGDRIAQAVVQKIDKLDGVMIKKVVRTGGLGSTGVE